MRRVVLSLFTVGALALSLLASPVAMRTASADVAFAQQLVLIKDARTVDLRARRFETVTGYDTHVFSSSHHKVDFNVYRLKEREKRFNYFVLDIDSRKVSGKGHGGRWMSYIAWTDRKTTATSYTSGLRQTQRKKCKTVTASLNASIGPVGGGVGVSQAMFCSKTARTTFEHTKSTRGRGGHWTAYRPAQVRHADFKKIIRVRPGNRPLFRVRLGAPCDYRTHTGALVTKTCYQRYAIRY